MDPRKIYGKAEGQQENQPGNKACSVPLPFALSVIVPNNCEHRNNSICPHGFLMHRPVKTICFARGPKPRLFFDQFL
jgi:hypothetical protein